MPRDADRSSTLVDPYAESVARRKVRGLLEAGKSVRVAMLDIDSTLTGDREAADQVRAVLETRGYVVTFNTSRTEEMVMTRASYEASSVRGRFHRPAPHLGREDDRRIDVPQERVEPMGLLDPDIIAGSTGTRILLRQRDGSYLPDESYGREEALAPQDWRRQVLALIDEINRMGRLVEPAAVENVENYEAGGSDVYPPDYRIQLGFSHPEDRIVALHRLCDIRHGANDSLSRTARGIRILDDSEPREDRYKAFVVPRWASKARAAHHILQRLCQDVGMEREHLGVLFVGDSYPDLHMALVGGVGVDATFLLAGRSRLMQVLWEPETVEFAGQSQRAVKRRLTRTHRSGYLRYRPPCSGNGNILVILGDIAYPGSAAVETVERYLETTESVD